MGTSGQSQLGCKFYTIPTDLSSAQLLVNHILDTGKNKDSVSSDTTHIAAWKGIEEQRGDICTCNYIDLKIEHVLTFSNSFLKKNEIC